MATPSTALRRAVLRRRPAHANKWRKADRYSQPCARADANIRTPQAGNKAERAFQCCGMRGLGPKARARLSMSKIAQALHHYQVRISHGNYRRPGARRSIWQRTCTAGELAHWRRTSVKASVQEADPASVGEAYGAVRSEKCVTPEAKAPPLSLPAAEGIQAGLAAPEAAFAACIRSGIADRPHPAAKRH